MNEKISWKSGVSLAAAAVSMAAALVATSCTQYGTQPGNVFLDESGRPRYGYRGTDSPNYKPERQTTAQEKPAATKKTPTIKRDPNNTTVDITPPEPKKKTPSTADSGSSSSSTSDDKPSDSGAGDTGSTSGSQTADTSSTDPDPKPASQQREDLPYGQPVVGKKGYVYSPYAPDKNFCDVRGVAPGTAVKCPYTGKPFRVP